MATIFLRLAYVLISVAHYDCFKETPLLQRIHGFGFNQKSMMEVRNLDVIQRPPFFKTLVDSGNVDRFENQFRRLENADKNSDDSTSRTKSVSERVLNDLDLTVNPCDNFYKFACGGFIKNSNTTNGASVAFTNPATQITKVVKRELQTEFSRRDSKPLLKAKKFFRSCMDENNIEQRGLTPVLQFLADRGGWPVLGSWNYKKFDYLDLLAKTRPMITDYEFHYQPTGAIIGMLIQKDFGQKNGYVIYLDQPSLGQFSFSGLLNHEVYRLGKNNIYNKAYEEYLIDIAVALGADPDVAKRDMCEVVKFETRLAENFLFEEERRRVDIRYNKISIVELSLRYPKIDWLRFLKKVLSIANIEISLNTKVVLWASPYFDRLGKILARTSKRTVANYILFRTIQPLLPALNKHIQYITLRYIAVVNGENEPRIPERSEFCTNIVNANMEWITGSIFVKNDFQSNTIEYTRKIKDYVRLVYTDMIYRSNWLSGITKKVALKKMNAIEDKIGYPEELFQKDFLRNYYKYFNIGKQFFENMEEVLTENYKIVLRKLANPPKNEWLLRPSSVNALHNLGTTSIEIPLGVIDEPFFSNDYPPSMNFGGIGFLIGHEYGHGFEVTGTKFDWNGIIRQYWSAKSMSEFAHRADCLVNQYSRYYIPEADLQIINGNKTLNENIPDNTGVVVGFYAYRKWKKDKNIDDVVPGLPFTGEQLYFINTARVWCMKASPLFLRKFPLLDHHALNHLRVVGPLQNSPEFSSAFKCHVGSFMNPVKKCRFW